MGIEDATDWMTACVGVPADPAPATRKRRTSLDAPVAPATAAEGAGGCTAGEKGQAPPTRGQN